MTPKQTLSSRSISSLIGRILKTVGVVITLAALFDMLILSLPYQFLDRQWQIDLVTSMVDRGIVPMVGIALFLTGFAVDGNNIEKKATWQDPRFWAFVLASLLGLFYVLMFPLHLNNVRMTNQTAVEQVDQQAVQLEKEIDDRLTQEMDSRRQQITQLLAANDSQLEQLIKNGQLTQEQANVVKGFKADPKSVESFLKKQEGDLRSQLQAELDKRKQTAQETRKTEDLKSGIRVSVSSLLLAIGFITIGWVGLRNLR